MMCRQLEKYGDWAWSCNNFHVDNASVANMWQKVELLGSVASAVAFII